MTERESYKNSESVQVNPIQSYLFLIRDLATSWNFQNKILNFLTVWKKSIEKKGSPYLNDPACLRLKNILRSLKKIVHMAAEGKIQANFLSEWPV